MKTAEGVTEKRTSILRRIWRIILVITIPLTALSVVCLVLLNMIYTRYDRSVQNITAVNSYNLDWEKDMNSTMYYLIVEANDWDKIIKEKNADNPYYLIDDMRSHFKSLAADNDDSEVENNLDMIFRVLDNLEKCVDEVADNIREGGHYDDNIEILKTDIYVMTDMIQENIQKYIYREAALMEQSREEIARNVRVLTWIIVVLIAFAFAATVSFSRWMTHKITDPIFGLVKATKMFSGGNFSVRFESNSHDEIDVLADSFNDMVREISLLVENIHRDERQMRDLELKLLQEQVNPHFLYNSLDAIMWLAEAGENALAVKMVSSLSTFFRTGLSKGRDWITVRDEESHTRSYLEIQQFRYQDILSYEIRIPEEIGGYYMMRLMLQPIVENALYHGIKNRRAMGHILVIGEKDGGDLVFTVKDDGIGMKPEELEHMRELISGQARDESDHGFGVANVQQRIQLRYGPEYGVTVESVYGEGTCVRVRIPALTSPGNSDLPGPGELSRIVDPDTNSDLSGAGEIIHKRGIRKFRI